jgi:DNA polymerase I-like protein with 3'-5' exonuclease and polymerase domains
MGHIYKGRVHPNINQTKGDEGGTGTGRLSYTRPALQQIPARDKEIAKIIRPIFLPDEGQGWAYGDLDQHEFRVFAHYVNAPILINKYKDNPDLDIHQTVADITGLPRNPNRSGGANAKQINLAMVFNMGGGALAERMGLPFTMESFVDKKGQVHEYKKPGDEAMEVITKYYEAVPGVREMAKNAASVAKTRGHVKTLMGRQIRFPGGQFTYKASGLIYQGTSADLNKDCIIRICEYLESECPDAHLLLNIHDEFNISMPYVETKHLFELQKVIQDRPELRVPIRVDFGCPKENWWEATQADSLTNAH